MNERRGNGESEAGRAHTAAKAETLGLDEAGLPASEMMSVRAEYRQMIPKFFGEIGDELVAAADPKTASNIDALARAHRIAHSMAGTAGSIGFADIGMLARAMTVALRDLLRRRRNEAGEATASPEASGGQEQRGRGPEAERPNGQTTMAEVIVVDDDPRFLAAVCAMGKENLISVLPASSGEEARRIASGRKLDAAIIDVRLAPGDNAFQIARDLRGMEGGESLPVAFISVDTSLENRIAATHTGGSLFLDKPLTSAGFLAAVRSLAPTEAHDRPRVLVIDDDETFLRGMAEMLGSEGMRVELLSDPRRVLEVTAAVRPDLILLDVLMPEVSGFEVCRVLRSTDMWRGLPVLFLTVKGGEEARIDCYSAGGDDYIEKPVVREELLARINARIDRVRLHRERADRDALTGVYSRRAFLDLCRVRITEAQRACRPLSLCLMDLDHFKQVNDNFGHLAGDGVLAGFGRLLSTRFRTADLRGRWGGEEFAVAFLGEDTATAAMILGRMKDEFCNMVFTGDHGEKFATSFSAGISAYPEDGGSFDELFRIADRRLYRAKRAGRNRIEF